MLTLTKVPVGLFQQPAQLMHHDYHRGNSHPHPVLQGLIIWDKNPKAKVYDAGQYNQVNEELSSQEKLGRLVLSAWCRWPWLCPCR
jgi:hypothetical protein